LEAGQLQGGRGVNGNGSSRTADFVILGAGVMGASIAFHLARRRAGRIVVLDKDHAGSGGSSRSSALVRMHYSFRA
jgi:sarcosine oxidase subunit beta